MVFASLEDKCLGTVEIIARSARQEQMKDLGVLLRVYAVAYRPSSPTRACPSAARAANHSLTRATGAASNAAATSSGVTDRPPA